MDAEPLRCRRTDGKKWRCRLSVIPHQKYCERHVHRGRICSRKHVEVHQPFLNSKSKSTSISSLKTTPNLQSHAKTKVSIKKHSHGNTTCKSLEFTSSSTNSLLQHGNDDLGRGASSNDHKIGQSERCRRTDGKKWRCKKDVLPGLKYCVKHLHRGVKKVENSDQKLNSSCLSFTVGASYQQQMGGNQSNDSTSSSEATTISM